MIFTQLFIDFHVDNPSTPRQFGDEDDHIFDYGFCELERVYDETCQCFLSDFSIKTCDFIAIFVTGNT